ncbi:MFS transporter [Pseudomonas sp. BN102]|uniref:MFS transporter n=1 Tax=Pseudomonas sp. BN102 TaxID=2567886 RepID=UPI002453B576|nr:MFS transporter [Pseudomonas sp. BN102]MDH4607473.1 MFS transporter [Pseudomonas sp. BN102]
MTNGTHSAKAPSYTWAWVTTATLAIAMVISFIDRFALSLLVEPIKASLAISDAQIGLLHGLAFGLFYSILGIPCGWLADRWSRTGTILLGLFVWCLATAACGLAGSFAGLLVARMFVGAGEAALAPAAYAVIYERFPRAILNRALTLFQAGAVVGAGTAFYIVGALYDWLEPIGLVDLGWLGASQPWQTTFLLVALPGLALLPVLWWVLNRRVGAAHGATPAATADPRSKGTKVIPYLIEDRAFIAAIFIGMSGLLTMSYALLTWIPAIFVREFQWVPGEIGRIYGAVVLFSCMGGMFAAAWIADRLSSRVRSAFSALRVPLYAGVLAIPAALVFLLASGPIGVLIACAALHGLCTCSIGIAPALIQRRSPEDIRSRISALYVMVVNICGLAVGPILVGSVVQLLGSGAPALRTAVFIVGGGGLLVSVATLGFFLRRQSAVGKVPTEQSV